MHEDEDFFLPTKKNSLLSLTTNLFLVSNIESILLDAKIDGIEELDAMHEDVAGDQTIAIVRGSTIFMDGKTRDIRDRIKSIKNTRKVTEAVRLVRLVSERYPLSVAS